MIALVDLLMRANWAKRVLFLADRVGAGEPGGQGVQGAPARRDARSTWSPRRRTDGRVYVSTYPTMMNLIDAGATATAPVRPGLLRPDRHRRGAPLGLPEVPGDLRLLRLAAGRV